jgi:hypothetical protein
VSRCRIERATAARARSCLSECRVKAHLHGDAPHILLSRAGEPDAVCVYLNEVQYLADALCSMAAEMLSRHFSWRPTSVFSSRSSRHLPSLTGTRR